MLGVVFEVRPSMALHLDGITMVGLLTWTDETIQVPSDVS